MIPSLVISSILLLGDSFTALPFEYTLPIALEERGFQVESHGLPGDTPQDYFTHSKKKQPGQKTVLLFYEGNDFLVPCDGPYGRTTWQILQKGLRFLTWEGVKNIIFSVRWRWGSLTDRKNLLGEEVPEFFLKPSWTSRTTGYVHWGIRDRHGIETRRVLPSQCQVKRAIETVQKIKPDLLFFIPEPYRVDEEFRKEANLLFRRSRNVGPFGVTDEIREQFLSLTDAETIDLGPGSYAGDGHWNEIGVGKVARLIAKRLRGKK